MAEAQKAQNHAIFLENFLDDARRKVSVFCWGLF